MSPRFWIVAAGFTLGGIFAGASLGSFATSSGQVGFRASSWAEPEATTGYADSSAPGHSAVGYTDAAPAPIEPIVCKGCGPTLAERQMTADAYDVGGVDPYLRDYGRSYLDEPAIPMEADHRRSGPARASHGPPDAPEQAATALPPPRPIALGVQ